MKKLITAIVAALSVTAQAGAAFPIAPLSSEDEEKLRAGEIIIHARKDGKLRRVETGILLNHSIEDVWAIMRDCESAPEFVPNMRDCDIIERSPDGATDIIEHQVKYGWIAPKTTYRFRADYTHHERIHFERTSGDLKHLEGEWLLEPADPEGNSVFVRYAVHIDPGFFVPGFVVRRALKKDLPKAMHALRERAAALSGDAL